MGKDKMIEKTIAEYEYLTGDEEIKRLEYLKNKAFRDEAACRRIGLEEGIEKGLIKGKRETTNKIAKQFLGKGIDINVISECTGLSKKEVQRLMDKIT